MNIDVIIEVKKFRVGSIIRFPQDILPTMEFIQSLISNTIQI